MIARFRRIVPLKKLLRRCFIVGVLAGAIAFLPICAPAEADGLPSSGTVTSIIDGDSLVVRHRGGSRQVRLWGIDAPEWDQPHAHHAKALLRRMLLGRKVRMEPYTLDKYGRIIAQVYLQDQSVNQLLVERGYAWVHIYYCRDAVCKKWKRVQAQAQKRGDGLWRDRGAVPPWQWKRMRKR